MLLRQAVLAVVFATTVGTAFAASNRVGDVNADDVVDSADVAYLATYLVGDGPAPQGPADVNGDGGVNVRDVFYLINFVFASGPGPVCAGATGGPCNTGGAGICAFGTVACSNGALVCVQNQQPQPEACNGIDDNCDGVADEGNPGGGQACTTGQPGVCAQGTTVCSSGGITCLQANQPSVEICGNSVDENCDGQLNEQCGCNVPTDCPGDDNACQTRTCINNSCGFLFAEPNRPCSDGSACTTQDACDGQGHCVGQPINCTDDDPCTTDTCANGVCNHAQSSCDDNIDCTTDLCGANGCTHTPNNALCEDNDPCTIDSCNPFSGCTHTSNSGASCNTGQPGLCAEGILSCDAEPVCTPVHQPTAEACNGVDDNCNGTVDDGNPGGGLQCNTNQAGVCAAGTTQCFNGSIACSQNVQPSAEVCDSKDNNCNGQTDEGNPGGGFACNTGNAGVCAAGTTQCVNGSIACAQNVQPSAEICDSKDNDCDGVIDEGNPGGGFACNTGQTGVCAAGTTSCTGGNVSCNRNVQPSPEICDGKDNDCDGQTDEGNPGGGQACSTQNCPAGFISCVNGALQCVCQ